MKIILSISLGLFTINGFCQALKMKPGLWDIEMTVTDGKGKSINPAAAMKDALAKIPEAQKKKMMEMMGEIKMPKFNNNGMEICYTEEMLKSPETMINKTQKDCDSKILSQTAKEIKTSFKCKDGTNGTALWKFLSDSNYEGVVNVNSPEKGTTSVQYTAKFKGRNCK